MHYSVVLLIIFLKVRTFFSKRLTLANKNGLPKYSFRANLFYLDVTDLKIVDVR